MAKVEVKTRPHDGSVEDFLNSVEDERQRSDSFRVLGMFERITGERGQMWGTAIVGFGHQVAEILVWPRDGLAARRFFAAKGHARAIHYGRLRKTQRVDGKAR
jgi:hypothetical protein